MPSLDALRSPLRTATAPLYKLASVLDRRPSRPFIVLSRSRTGSNMLMSFLNSHPNVRMEGELFATLDDRSPTQALEAAFSPPPAYVKAQGFKLFYYHPTDAPDRRLWAALTALPDLHVIHLKRRNILHTLVSHKIASRTDVWIVTNSDDTPAPSPSITLDVEEARRGFEQTRAWEQHGEALFGAHPRVSVDYEDLVQSPDDTFGRITDLLNVRSLPPKTRLRKQNRRPMRTVLTNYDELKAAFLDTEWAAFFDE